MVLLEFYVETLYMDGFHFYFNYCYYHFYFLFVQRVCLSFKTGSSVGSATPTGNQISSR